MKQRKSFTKKEQLAIFMRDGFIDRYSGGKLIFPGVLAILSSTMPDVFPYHDNWKTDQCHQAWWDLFPSIDHIVPLAFGGTNDEDNLVCTSMKRNMAKATSSLEEIGWELHPAGKLPEWDGMMLWFVTYAQRYHQIRDNAYIREWYETFQKSETARTFRTNYPLDFLLKGENVLCHQCWKGYYRPANPKYTINHWFTCDHCGGHFHWDPVVDIE